MSTCDEVRGNLGGYVLHGLEPDESRTVREHLAACDACAVEAAELETVPDLLALLDDAPPTPPLDVRDRVLAEARGRRSTRRRAVGAAAAIVALVLAGVGVMAGRDLGGDAARAPARQAEWTTALRAGEGSDASGQLTLVRSGTGLMVELEVTGLDPLPRTGVYEAWLRSPDRDEPVSIGRFEGRPDGTTAVTFTAAGSRADYDGFWITREPDAVDPAHQGPTVLWADIP